MTVRNAWALGLAAVALAIASLRHRRRAHAACDRLPIMEGLALRGEWEGWWESGQADPSDEIAGGAAPEALNTFGRIQWQT
jgi:hypothetical protein